MISKLTDIARKPKIGEYTVVEDYVVIGKNAVIGHHVVIHSGTVIGDNVRIDDFACIGKKPMRAKNSAGKPSGEAERCFIGNGVIIGTGAVLYCGCRLSDGCMAADGATVREGVTVGKDTIIGRNACIENDCRIGGRVKIETNAYITAHSEVEDGCFVAPGVVTSNDNFAGRGRERFSRFKGVVLRKGGRIGAGAVILPGRTIGEDGFAAAGSVVTRDVEPKTIVCGSPARKLRDVPEEQLLENDESPDQPQCGETPSGG